MSITTPTVPTTFGTGGSGLYPNATEPNLPTILRAMRVDLAAHDAIVNGTRDAKDSVRFATTANITIASAGLSVIDGVTPVAGDRALVKDQSSPAQNGVYVVGATAWTRATDADTSAKVTAGLTAFVSEGTVNGNTQWDLTTDDAITLGSTSLTFTKRPQLSELASTATGKGASLIGIFDTGSIITATTVEAALQEIKTLVDAGMQVAKKTVTLTNGAVTATPDTDGTAFVANIGTALPANARVVGVDLNTATAWSGGGLASMTLKVGTSGDNDAIVATSDLFAAVVDGGPATMSLGVRPFKKMGAVQLIATLTPDGSSKTSDATAGATTVDVTYVVLV